MGVGWRPLTIIVVVCTSAHLAGEANSIGHGLVRFVIDTSLDSALMMSASWPSGACAEGVRPWSALLVADRVAHVVRALGQLGGNDP